MRLTLGAAAIGAAMLACRPAAPSGFTLLFLGRSPAAQLAGRSWVADPDHSRIVGFDRSLRIARALAPAELGEPVAVAAYRDRLLVTERIGDAVVLDTAGHALREWPSVDRASLYGARDSLIVAVRSPYRVPAIDFEPDTAPLFRVLDSTGRPVEGIAAVRVPANPLLTGFVNAGAAAVGPGGALYFAPLAADEIRRYDRGGKLRWVTHRGIVRAPADPHYGPPRGGAPSVVAAVVNLALALGPDGRLYALGADDSAGTLLRVDVLDTATGAVVATKKLGPRETAIALDPRGGIATFDADTLLAQTSGSPREPFAPAFALPDLHGDTVRLAQFAGKVTLVNFWASWCDPCREEFPHMADLFAAFPRNDFEIAAISDDVDRGKMLAFVAQYHPPFPILAGSGAMKAAYHYRGLPYSVLLDRHGRVVERIFGFGGAPEFAALRDAIAKEIAAP